MIKSCNLSEVTAIKIKIDGFSDQIVHGSIGVVEYGGKKALFLGEFNMWYWIAPLDNLKAIKVADSDYEDFDEELTFKQLKGMLNDNT
jgi:hypothetical protein